MLNMDNLKLTEKWAKEKVKFWTLDEIVGAVANVSFRLYDYRYPRNFEEVITTFIKQMSNLDICEKLSSVIAYDKTLNDICKVIRTELMSIKAFREWNLTTTQYEHGVDVDNNNGEWFDEGPKDFVDLDAFMQNVYCELRKILIEDYFFRG